MTKKKWDSLELERASHNATPIKKTKRISVSSAKAKARKLQQMICAKVSKLLNIPWGSEDDKLIQSRPMGQSGTDIVLRGEVLERFPFSVECKWNEKWDVHGSIKQAKANQKNGTDWLLFMKRSREDPVVILDVDVFFEILKEKRSD